MGASPQEPPLQPTAHSTVSSTSSNRGGFVLTVKGTTWAPDSHGLFDYESSNVYSRHFRCSCLRDSYSIFMDRSQLNFSESPVAQISNNLSNETCLRPLVDVKWSDGALWLSPPTQEKLWLVVRSVRAVALHAGDIIKLGRFRVRVRGVVTKDDPHMPLTQRLQADDEDDEKDAAAERPSAAVAEIETEIVGLSSDNQDESACLDTARDLEEGGHPRRHPLSNLVERSNVVKLTADAAVCDGGADGVNSSDRACRICLCNDEEDSPLVSPCRCSGSMTWVHLHCIRTWMAGRLNIQPDRGFYCFFWRSLECELCKAPYPKKVKVTRETEEMTDLFELPALEAPYVILEARGSSSSNNSPNRGVHVVSLAGNRVARLGRGHESDIRLADISVSRLHANLRWNYGSRRSMASEGFAVVDGGASLEDMRSKFGTLLELRRPVRLEPDTTLSVQAGRTVVLFALKKKWRILPVCLRQGTADIALIQSSAPQEQQDQQHGRLQEQDQQHGREQR